MTRRDTIIVAVLINAGLLVVLFISSLRSDANHVAASHEKKSVPTQTVKKEAPIAKAPSDQVDQILAQYSKKLAKEPVKEEKKVHKETPVENVKTEESSAEQVKEEKVAVNKGIGNAESAAPSTKESETSSRSAQVKVVVKKGDVLEKLAKTYGTTVGAIMQENQLTDSRLQIGQVIYITQHAKTNSAIKVIPPLEERYYVVKNGDNLWKIAIEHHLKVDELLKLNQLNEKQAKALRPGDRLRIK